MPQTVDERIVEMRIDKDQFEHGAQQVMRTMDKLRESTNFGSLNFDGLDEKFEKLSDNFEKTTNGLYSRWKQNFHDKVVDLINTLPRKFSEIVGKIEKELEQFTVQPIGTGFEKFGEKTSAVETLKAQGYELDKVNDLMEQLNWFTDETSYNFTDMVSNIAKFTATGQDLDKSVTAMEGIALWAALSGQGAQKASQAMYQLSQAMTKGALKFDDFKSIQNASMDTKEFREQAVAAAESLGVLKKVGEDTWQTMGDSEGTEKAVQEAYKKWRDAVEDLKDAQLDQSEAYAEAQKKNVEVSNKTSRSLQKHVDNAQEKVDELYAKFLAAQDELNKGFSLSELFSSEGLTKNAWFTSDVMMEVFNKYSKAVNELQRYIEDHEGIDTATEAIKALEEEANSLSAAMGITLDEAFQRLGYDIDEFALKAFKAGQEARKWSDVVDSIKDATGTGWMNIFETVIGDADQATKFFSTMAEDLYNIFMGPIERIQEFVDVAFGGKTAKKVETATTQMTEGWVMLQDRVDSTGHSIEEFITVLEDVYGYRNGAILSDLVSKYGSLEEVFKAGEISAEDLSLALSLLTKESYALGNTAGTKLLGLAKDGLLVGDQLQDAMAALPFFDSTASYPGFDALIEDFRDGKISAEEFVDALNELAPTFDNGFDGGTASVEQMTHSLEELKEVALGIIRGDFGNGQARRDMLESMGYNYDLVQGLAEIMYNGGQGLVGITEELLESEYPTFYAMMQNQITATRDYTESIGDLGEGLEDVSDILAAFSKTTSEVTNAQEEEAKILKNLLPNMRANLKDAEDELTQIQEEIAEKGIDINKTVYGNIDTNNRQILLWTEENLEKYADALESWGIKAEEVAGDISTVLGGSAEFRGLEIAYSPILQTENGPELLTSETVNAYINGLFEVIEKSGREATPELLLELDSKGFEVDGRIVKGLLADIGDTAIQTGEAMHYVGANGALEKAKRNLEDVKQAAQEFLEMTGREHWQSGLHNLLDYINNVLQAIYAGFDKVFGSIEDRGSGFKTLMERFHDWTIGLEVTDEKFERISNTAAFFFVKLKNLGDVVKTLWQALKVVALIALNVANAFLQGIFASGELRKGIQGIVDSTGQLGKEMPSLSDIIRSVVGWLITNLPKILEIAFKLGQTTYEIGAGLVDLAATVLQAVGRAISDVLGLIASVFPGFQSAADSITEWLTGILGKSAEDGEKELPKWNALFGDLENTASGTVDRILKIFGYENFGKTFDDIKTRVTNAFQAVKDFFSGNTVSNDGLNGKVNETQGVLEAAFSWFSGDKVKTSVVDVDGMFPSQEEVGTKAEGFWTNTFNTIKSKFGSVSLSKMFNLAKLGVLAYTLMSVNKFINSVKITVDPRKNGLFGVMDSLKKTISNIGSPFAAFAKKITTEARADEMIKLAAAIGILSLSLMGLSMLDEQTLFNVSAVLMGLMLVLKGLSGAGNGIQIFSNNVKKVTGDVSATFDVLKNFSLKDMKAFFENIRLEASVIPKTMGTLLGLATLFGVIAIVFLKIKDIKSIDEVLPALKVIGIVLGAIVVVLGIAAAASKYMKGMGATFLGMAVAFVVIGEALKAIQNIEWSVGGIFGAVAAIAVFGMLLWAVSDLIDSKNIEKISGKKMLAFAASIMLLGVTFSTIGATLTLMSMFAKPEGLLMAGVALTAVAGGMAAIVYAFSKVPAESSMLKAAASMMIIALALQMMAVPIVLLSAIALVLGGPMIAVSVGLAMFSAAMATIIGVLSAKGGDHILQAAGSLVIVSVALGIISRAITNIASLDLASMAESCVALIVVLAVMAKAIGYLSSDKVDSTKLIEGAAAMLALAVAVVAVGVGIGAIASLDIGGIAAATVALGLMIGLMAVLLNWLSKIEPSKLGPAAAAMVLAAAAVDLLALGLAGLTIGFVNLVQNGSWEEFGAKAKAMSTALEPLSGWIIGIGVAFVGLIVIAALAGDKLALAGDKFGLAGLGIAGVGVGVLAVVYAFSLLPAAVQGIVDAMDILNQNVGKVVEFVLLVTGIVLAVLIAKQKEFGKAIIGIAEACASVLTNAQTLSTFATAITTLGGFLIAFLMGAMPGLVDKVLELVITFFNSLADAINSHVDQITSAIEKVLIALVNVIFQTLTRLIGDALGFMFGGIGKLLARFGVELDPDSVLGDLLNFESWHEAGRNLAGGMGEMADTAFESISPKVIENSEQLAADGMAAAQNGIENNTGALVDAAGNATSDVMAEVNSEVETGMDTAQAIATEKATEMGDSSSAAAAEAFKNGDYAGAMEMFMSESADNSVGGFLSTIQSYLPSFSASGEDASGSMWGGFETASDGDIGSAIKSAAEQAGLSLDRYEDFFGGKGADVSGYLTDGASAELPKGTEEYAEILVNQLDKNVESNKDKIKKIGVFASDEVRYGYLDQMVHHDASLIAGGTVSNINTEIQNKQSDISKIGTWFSEQFRIGYLAQMATDAVTMVRDTVSGLSEAVNNENSELYVIGVSLFEAIYQGYRSAADQHSPSRVMQQEMAYTIQGLVVGAEKNAKNAFNAMEAVGDGMMNAMHNSMSRLALAVDRDYDIQPKITPIVDLGPASRGASALSNMMNGGTIRSIAESYRSMEGLAISGATLNYTSQNAPVTSAIDGLSKKMDRFTKSLDEDRNFNVDIRVDQMAVRDESDIRAISKQLAKEVRVALRQKGTR